MEAGEAQGAAYAVEQHDGPAEGSGGVHGPDVEDHRGRHAEADDVRQGIEFGAEARAAAEQPRQPAVGSVEEGGHHDRQDRVAPLAEKGELYAGQPGAQRSEEHTSELQSLMRISYAVFCLKKKK